MVSEDKLLQGKFVLASQGGRKFCVQRDHGEYRVAGGNVAQVWIHGTLATKRHGR